MSNLRQNIEALIIENRTREAIHVLIEYERTIKNKLLRSELLILSNRYEEARKQYYSNIIKSSDFNIIINKININVLNVTSDIVRIETKDEAYSSKKIYTKISKWLKVFTFDTKISYGRASIELDDNYEKIKAERVQQFIEEARKNKIKKLNLSGFNLDNLPKSMQDLTDLVELNLSNNRFQVVPEEISGLKNLSFLDISHNDISYLPEWIGKLPKLTTLNIRDNKFDSIPSEIYNRPSREIINYIIESSKNNESQRLNECKLIVVGSGEVGKTSLINMITTGKYNPNEQKTDGIEIKKWKLNVQDKTVKINIWDFGGQEIMHATHRFFMTRRSIYVLVVNPRIDDKYGDTEINYWLKLITSFSPKSAIIIAVNKCETHKTDYGEGSLKETFPQIIDFVETSCTKNLGIDTLKEKINVAISKTPHLNDKLPANFFEIRRRLELSNDAFMHYNQYENLCKEIDSSIDKLMSKTYLGFLNDLGIMLNISGNRKLEDTQVLNPEWITNGVYSIINSKLLAEQKGVVNESQLSSILDKNQYPTAKERGYIMDMMQHFELCYQMPNESDVFFVPGIFPKDKPKNISWDNSKNLVFIYCLDVLPSSVISRFIVRIHPFIHKKYFWRNGVILNHKIEKNIAFIYVAPAERRIFIKIYGEGNRRTTLSYIRTEFQKIFVGIDKLKFEGFIPLDEDNEHLVSYEDLVAHERMGEQNMVIPSLMMKINVKQYLEGIENKIDKGVLKGKVAKGELESVFEELFKSYEDDNEIIANLGRLRDLNRSIRLGIHENPDIETRKLRTSLLALIDELVLD